VFWIGKRVRAFGEDLQAAVYSELEYWIEAALGKLSKALYVRYILVEGCGRDLL
jgi:hypothetical protein